MRTRNYILLSALVLFMAFSSSARAQIPPSPPTFQVSAGTGTADSYLLRGQAAPGATVNIKTSGGSTCKDKTIAGADGSFSCTLSGTPANGESITASQTTVDGQTSAEQTTPGAIKQIPGTDANRAFLKDGVFGCGTGSYAMNVGTMNAIGGVYVPVNDAAVTQNTGYLVYKFCVLDGIVVREREAATAAFVKASLDKITGKGGTPAYVTNIQEYLKQQGDKTAVEFAKKYNLNAACTPFRDIVKSTIIKDYLQNRNKDNALITCTLPNNGANPENGLAALAKIADDPSNTLLGSYYGAKRTLLNQLSAKETDTRQELLQNDGFMDVKKDDVTPTDTGEEKLTPRTLTPGSIVKTIADQMVTSGYRQLESADAVDQIINALFSGLSTDILTDAGGLTGISQQQGTKPSYLNQVSQGAIAGLRQTVTNNALTIVFNAISVEGQYRKAQEKIGIAVLDARTKLRFAENACWNMIIPKVQERAAAGTLNADGTSSGVGVTLAIATSTQFSDAIIRTQLQPLADVAKQGLDKSDAGLVALQSLASNLQNTASLSLQNVALHQLDNLLANRTVHTEFDLKAVQGQADVVQTSMTNLVTDTVKAWGDSPTNPPGWCNINNPSVIDFWFNQWRR